MPHAGTFPITSHHTHAGTMSSKLTTAHDVRTHSKIEKPGLVPEVIHAPFEIPDFEGTLELHAQVVIPTNKQHSL